MATVTDVARLAGVSTSTVSRVLANTGYASSASRHAVVSAAKKLGYAPNQMARGLKTQRSGLIALLTQEAVDPDTLSIIPRVVEDVAKKHGFQLILCNGEDDRTQDQDSIDLVIGKAVEGLMITSSNLPPRTLTLLEERGLPIVLVNTCMKGFNFDAVRSDNVIGAKLLVQHLAQLGHRKICLINGPAHAPLATDRADAFRKALAEADLEWSEDLISWGGWNPEEAERRVVALLDTRRDITAVVGATFYMTVGAVKALRQLGMRLPEDVAVVSFNDLSLAAEIDPFLTALSQPTSTLGRIAADLLVERINGQYTGLSRDVALAPSLIVRRSCGSALARATDRAVNPTCKKAFLARERGASN